MPQLDRSVNNNLLNVTLM